MLHMENFITGKCFRVFVCSFLNCSTGFPGHEYQIREALDEVLGKDDAEFFFDKVRDLTYLLQGFSHFDQFLEYFFTEADAKFYKSLGLNCLRIAFHYHHFEDDMNPRVLKPKGFALLDRVVDICAQAGIYTVLDLHAVPGAQSGGWHSDNPNPASNDFWRYKDFQDRAIWLWEHLAAHYKGNPWVAGFNPLNEPAVKDPAKLVGWYDRVHDAIRAIDEDHILFFDGNIFAKDFSGFGDAHTRWRNATYSYHDYAVYGFPSSLERYEANDKQLQKLKETFEKKRSWMVERSLAEWNGEFG